MWKRLCVPFSWHCRYNYAKSFHRPNTPLVPDFSDSCHFNIHHFNINHFHHFQKGLLRQAPPQLQVSVSVFHPTTLFVGRSLKPCFPGVLIKSSFVTAILTAGHKLVEVSLKAGFETSSNKSPLTWITSPEDCYDVRGILLESISFYCLRFVYNFFLLNDIYLDLRKKLKIYFLLLISKFSSLIELLVFVYLSGILYFLC